MADGNKLPCALPALEPGAGPGNLEPTKAALPARKLAKTPADQRFDIWLEKQLHDMYEIE